VSRSEVGTNNIKGVCDVVIKTLPIIDLLRNRGEYALLNIVVCMYFNC